MSDYFHEKCELGAAVGKIVLQLRDREVPEELIVVELARLAFSVAIYGAPAGQEHDKALQLCFVGLHKALVDFDLDPLEEGAAGLSDLYRSYLATASH